MEGPGCASPTVTPTSRPAFNRFSNFQAYQDLRHLEPACASLRADHLSLKERAGSDAARPSLRRQQRPQLSDRAREDPSGQYRRHYNAAHGADTFGFRKLKSVCWNLEAPRALSRSRSQSRRGHARPGRRARAPRPASIPAARPRTSSSSATRPPRTSVWWENNGAITPRAVRHAAGRLPRRMPRARSSSRRTSTAAPTRRTASRRASSPNTPGTRCSSATC